MSITNMVSVCIRSGLVVLLAVGAGACDDDSASGTQQGDGALIGDGAPTLDGEGSEGDSESDQQTNERCGDGLMKEGEQCDDGNTRSGDGCDSSCQLEEGANCQVVGAACEQCGNGIVESTETCDDGNRASSDGCDQTCKIEAGGWVCPTAGQPCERCGDGVVSANERCDEGSHADGVGCASDCRRIDPNYSCGTGGVACVECGNGQVELAEACDDGNTRSGDGCVFSCRAVEPGWACPPAGGACSLCGDGIINPGEACDDGNFQNGDGCSASCQLEPGAVCPLLGEFCSVCGNGVIEPSAIDTKGTPEVTDDVVTVEGCDDGNRNASDGCDASCQRELGYECPIPGMACARCGDNVVQAIERCDDGADPNTGLPVGGDGCSADCAVIEPHYNCPAGGGRCVLCGNAIREPGEACDDGKSPTLNQPVGGDGCSRDCQRVESGWSCTYAENGAFLGCLRCGNGLREGSEACDDGNTVGGDGCTATCAGVEATFNCFYAGYPCVQCGNGKVEAGEECDEGHLANAANQTAGCNAQCRITEGWVCPQAGARCERCGDATVEAHEECDDGNTHNDDGCSASCTVEPGYACTGSGSCAAAGCGDGVRAGAEACDDGNQLAGDGCGFLCQIEEGWACPGGGGCRRATCGDSVVEGTETCDDGNRTSSDGCSATCRFELGYDCPTPGAACQATVCGDGAVRGGEQCDDGAATGGDGCSATCQLEPGYHCPTAGAACQPTVCGDGRVQGLEACDDGNTNGGDGCGGACATERLYRCTNATDQASTCTPIMEFVSVLRFNVQNVNPAGLVYDPQRRSFAAHKSQSSQPPLELCLDGTILNPGDNTCAGENGCVIRPTGAKTPLDPRCASGPTVPGVCYAYPPRPVSDGTLVGAAYDPFTDRYLFLTKQGQTVTLTHVPRTIEAGNPNLAKYQVALSGAIAAPGEGTVGEDGNLYLADQGASRVLVFRRRRDANLNVYTPDCVAAPEANCTGFEATPDPAAGWSVASVDPLSAMFTVPGEDLIGAFNRPTGQPSYAGTDQGGAPITTAEYFTLFDPSSAEASRIYGRSGLPGLLFKLGANGFSYSQEAKAAETAPDGGFFVVCPANPSEACQLFARTCASDLGCSAVPGTRCNTGAAVPYCHAPGEARDDRAQVGIGSSDNVIDVLANDTLSESACVAPFKRIVSVDETGLRGDIVGFSPGATTLSYSAPADDSCGFTDTFTYVADLGGGVLDSATVRVVVACICGDGIIQGNEQCDAGGANAGPPARCGTSCRFNVICGDTFTDAGEECDDGNLASGDGCSARCTLESVCGDGQLEGIEDCDDGNRVSGDGCSVNCTRPVCGDGSLDLDNAEQCDDGNTRDADGCSRLCRIETRCGNGQVELGEQCDDGGIIPGDGCSAACTIETACGDGTINTTAGEMCDPAFTGPQCGGVALCTSRCICENFCGDGRIGGLEACDDGKNGALGDGCRDDCTAEFCGDGIKDPAEQCDDGNTIPTDGCSNACLLVTICGNGKVEGQEQCDDGNNRSGDGCSSACRTEATVCGNGVVEYNEQCDDSNTVSGDGCDAQCRDEGGVCGNGVVELGEECDDGNTTDGDECDPQCRWDTGLH